MTVPAPVVLVTSASRKVPLVNALKNAAKRIHPNAKVVAGDMNPNCVAFHFADDAWVMPPAAEPQLDQILEECKHRSITAILPTRDSELLFWARNAELIARHGTSVILSPASTVMTCLDKLAFSELGKARGFPIIAASKNISELKAQRFVVKERFGSGSKAIGIALAHEEAMHHAQGLSEPIFQPFVEGHEFSVDAWIDRKHRVKGLILRRRDLVVQGESQVTTTFTDVGLEKDIHHILEALKLRGPVVLQAIASKSSGLQIIECNARFGGASTAGIAAGLDSLYWSLLEACGQDADQAPFLRTKTEIRQVRAPVDFTFP